MKKRFSKLLILSMTTALTITMASVNVFAEDDASEVSATYACEASIPNASDYGIPELNSDIVAGLKSMGDQFNANYQYVDATKSTYIQFYGSPVQQFAYDGNPHGLAAGVYATIGNTKVAEANMYYIGQLSDGTYYASSYAPTEPGVYYVAASYAGSNDYYPIISYGIIYIKGNQTPENPDPENPDKPNPDPENPDKPNPDPENPDKPNPDPENPDKPNPDPENPDKPDPENPDKPDSGKKEDDNKKDPVVDNKNNNDNNKPTTTSTKTNTKDTTKSPKTGDTANTMTYVVTLTLAGIVGVVAVLMRRKKH